MGAAAEVVVAEGVVPVAFVLLGETALKVVFPAEISFIEVLVDEPFPVADRRFFHGALSFFQVESLDEDGLVHLFRRLPGRPLGHIFQVDGQEKGIGRFLGPGEGQVIFVNDGLEAVAGLQRQKRRHQGEDFFHSFVLVIV